MSFRLRFRIDDLDGRVCQAHGDRLSGGAREIERIGGPRIRIIQFSQRVGSQREIRIEVVSVIPVVAAEVVVAGYGSLGGELPAVPLAIRGIVSGSIEQRGAFSYILDLAAREGFSGSPVVRTDSGEVAGILTRVHGPVGGSGPGGASPAPALDGLIAAIGRSGISRR